ncbi:hypothetical protein WH47_00972 [Habropoda laboriosa]|uniref:Chitin-binding type-2 domain-containing protein n=1 Tax=Habropoda laboriosa TaxID=597456 RepID=A0A0L7R5I3_9HYME|nr:hypothetical protein WH47_00972 [Habropoda laboriosa]
MRLIIFVLYSILIMAESSKCPESRKPHSISCTIFYSCVNLPGGGYVWVPSKCTEGLIFQPYLRMCVLPGDSWACDTLSTESSYITKRYDTPELLDPNETSYMRSTEDPLNFSELIDSSYTTDSIPDESNQEIATPYPLIEFEETIENNANNVSTINTDSMLNKLVHHLLIYKEITIPLEFLVSSLSTPSRPASNLPLSSYLIQNYIQQNNNLQNTIITGAKLQNVTEDSAIIKENIADKLNASVSNMESSSDVLQMVFENLDDNNNIILISDNAGNKQYLTVEKYKSLGYRLDSQFVHVIPCIKNIRMPNMTDCIRYYICEPQMVSVIEYLCPLYTAFNKYAKTCDMETYNKCIENRKEEVDSSGGLENILQLNMPNKNICTEQGKMKDPTSESRYYICYSAGGNSQNFKSIRMTCPNSLLFCQTKKVCTTKRLCRTT